jgi:hypothetical protein
MIRGASRLPYTATRLWARLYTVGLPDDVKNTRRAEVESDVFESQVTSPSFLEGLLCLVGGVPDDLVWRASRVESSLALLQSLLVLLAPGSAVSLVTLCFVLPLGISPLSAIGPGLLTSMAVGLLMIRTDKEEIEVTMPPTNETPVLPHRFEAIAAFVAPVIMLASMLMIGLDSHPQEDDSEIVDFAAAHSVQFAAGYVLFALSLVFVSLAVLQVGDVLRERGSQLIGSLAPAFFLVAASLVMVCGHGAQGIPLALVTRAGLSARDYYLEANNDSVIGLVAFLATIPAGMSLLTLGIAVWRARIMPGPLHIGVPVAFALFGLLFVITSGWTVSVGSLLIPLFVAIAIWPMAWRQLTSSSMPGSRISGTAPTLA